MYESVKCHSHSHVFQSLLQNASSVEKALEKFTSPESLQNDNAYKCPKCKKKAPATKRFTVHREPNVITIQLKRFEFNRFSGGKITKPVTFNEILNLRPYMSDPTGDRLTYRLNAVLVHFGGSCNSGHYLCYVRGPNNSWFKMDDESVEPVPLTQVLLQNAYILFYIKKIINPIPKLVANGHVVAANRNSPVRVPTPLPENVKKPLVQSKLFTGKLPSPFSRPTTDAKPIAVTAFKTVNQPKIISEPTVKTFNQPKIITEPEINRVKNGPPAASNLPSIRSGMNLVEYPSSDSDDENTDQKPTPGRLSSSSNGVDLNGHQPNGIQKPHNETLNRTSGPSQAATSDEFKKLEQGTLSSFGSNGM